MGGRRLNPATLLPSAIGIDARAPAAERAEAEKFEAFVLSPLTSVTTQTINPYTWGSREAQINTWFDANIVR